MNITEFLEGIKKTLKELYPSWTDVPSIIEHPKGIQAIVDVLGDPKTYSNPDCRSIALALYEALKNRGYRLLIDRSSADQRETEAIEELAGWDGYGLPFEARKVIMLATAFQKQLMLERIERVAAEWKEDENSQKEEQKKTRADIVRSIMKSRTDFRDREKAKELARKLDGASIKLPVRRGPQISKCEPKTFVEVAQKPTKNSEYIRIFDPHDGILARDLGKR